MLPFSLFNKVNESSVIQPDTPAKKIFSFKILIAVLLISLPVCFITLNVHPTDTSSYHAKLLEQMENASTFEEFTDALFRYEVTSDSITTAYTIKNAENWNIPPQEPKLTSFSYNEYLKNSTDNTADESTQFVLDCLEQYSSKDLSKDERLTHALLKDYLHTCSALSEYPFYEGLLGSSSGIQSNLPVTLGEYPLRNETDVKTYLQLLTQIPTYFEDVISYEDKRLDLGYDTPAFVTATALNSTKTMTNGFKNGDNSFVDTFNERITQINSLSKKEIKHYQQTNQAYVEKYVIPSYEMLVEYLEKTLSDIEDNTASTHSSNTDISKTEKGTNTDTSEITSDSFNLLAYMDEKTPYGTCTLPKGKEYYTLLAHQSTSSKKSVEQMISMTEQSLSNALGTVLNTALTDQEAYFYYCEHPLETYYQSPEAILDNLSLMIRENYPPLTKPPTYELKTVPESLSGCLSPAFYMIPAIDDYKNNTIYINQLYTNEENGNLFPTLAHEGFPGHLYQTVYFNESNPSDIRQILDYLGYVEGWATYVEMDSLTFLEYPLEGNSLCNLYQAETIINLALSARIDMGVNYEGWTLADTRAYFEEQGFNSYYAQDVYSYVVEAPTSYLSYFIGYLEIMDIKDAYQRQELENYSEMEFHRRLLDIGPADFETVKKYVLKN